MWGTSCLDFRTVVSTYLQHLWLSFPSFSFHALVCWLKNQGFRQQFFGLCRTCAFAGIYGTFWLIFLCWQSCCQFIHSTVWFCLIFIQFYFLTCQEDGWIRAHVSSGSKLSEELPFISVNFRIPSWERLFDPIPSWCLHSFRCSCRFSF